MTIDSLKKYFRPIYIPVIAEIKNIRMQISHPILIMSSLHTIRHIRKNNYSVCRYGDGELKIMFNKGNIGFQKWSDSLACELKRVFYEENKNLLICLPACAVSTAGMKKYSSQYWRKWMLDDNNRVRLYEFICKTGKKNYFFGDAMFTRPYMDWKRRKRAAKVFKELDLLWKDRKLLVVEGEQTRLGVGNDLFCGAKSVRRIIVPAVGAYNSYAQIKNAVISHLNEDLVLLAIGPTATVLAADLSKMGIQAIDIGHIDIEYEWFLRNSDQKERIPGKYVNEVADGRIFTECNNTNYQRQIITRIDV